jgi:hypothetical protein
MRQLTKHAFEVGDALCGGHKLVAARCDLNELDAITGTDFEVVANLGGDGDSSFAFESGCCHLEFLFPHSKVRRDICQHTQGAGLVVGGAANLTALHKRMVNPRHGISLMQMRLLLACAV